MHIPSLSFFRHPKETVLEFLEKPDYKLALLFVIVPSFLGFISFLINGLNANIITTIFSALKSIITWLVLSFVFFAGHKIVRKETLVRHDFKGFASALSLIWFGFIVVSILATVLLLFVSPSTKTVINVVENENLSIRTGINIINSIESRDSERLNLLISENNLNVKNSNDLRNAYNSYSGQFFLPIVIIALIAAIIFIISAIIVPYVVIRETFNWGPILNVIILAVLGSVVFILLNGINSFIPF